MILPLYTVHHPWKETKLIISRFLIVQEQLILRAKEPNLTRPGDAVTGLPNATEKEDQ